MSKDKGASAAADRATRQSPSPSVSALRASIPSAFAEWAETVSATMTLALSTGATVVVRAVPIEAWPSIITRLACSPDDWKPITTAPFYEVVEVKVGAMTFLATLNPDCALDEDERPCSQWAAENEGEHPPCWSEGACWTSNEDEVASLQPTAWRYPAQAIEARRAETQSGSVADESAVPKGCAQEGQP